MTIFTKLLIKRAREKEKYFNNYQQYAQLIRKESQKFLGEVKVFIFGSVLKKEETPQDIDILIISSKFTDVAKKSELRVKLWQKIGFNSPFEIHLITPAEYQDWYRFFIKEKKEIK